MGALIVGLILMAGGVVLLVPMGNWAGWWGEFVQFIRGAVPPLLVLIGLGSVLIGISSIKDKIAEKREQLEEEEEEEEKGKEA